MALGNQTSLLTCSGKLSFTPSYHPVSKNKFILGTRCLDIVDTSLLQNIGVQSHQT